MRLQKHAANPVELDRLSVVGKAPTSFEQSQHQRRLTLVLAKVMIKRRRVYDNISASVNHKSGKSPSL